MAYHPKLSQKPVLLDGTPETRSQCVDGLRPCPWVRCKYHLYIEVAVNSRIGCHHRHKRLSEIPETCALDLAERDGMRWEDIGKVLGITSQAARNIGKLAMRTMKDTL